MVRARAETIEKAAQIAGRLVYLRGVLNKPQLFTKEELFKELDVGLADLIQRADILMGELGTDAITPMGLKEVDIPPADEGKAV